MDNYKKPDHEGVKMSWDAVQQNLACCGVANYEDWEKRGFGAGNVPDSCCRTEEDNCGTGFEENDIFTDGCWTTIENTIENNSNLALGIGIGVVVVLIIVAVAACRV